MENWDEKSSNEILTELKTMQQEHEALKDNIFLMVTKLEKIELKFKKGNEALVNRLKINNE